MSKWKYFVKQTDDNKLESVLNEWTKNGLELVTVYPRGQVNTHVVFRKKLKE